MEREKNINRLCVGGAVLQLSFLPLADEAIKAIHQKMMKYSKFYLKLKTL